jgi:hypothetical protein
VQLDYRQPDQYRSATGHTGGRETNRAGAIPGFFDADQSAASRWTGGRISTIRMRPRRSGPL